ncbi:pinopsin isoform X2 [Corapipo altera]|uniref:pinopsin isoform X2 n=1 Tax=Corapipo altera TaxID=415028 RepID=UPI000FD66F97|nr:pinopsin isoform X2 [Corapipo altera]
MYSPDSSQEPPNNGTPGPFDGPQWPHQAPRAVYLSVAVLMGLVVVSASVVNGLVIVVSIRYKKLRSPLNYILVNLAVADLLVTLCGSSVSLSNNISGFFVFGKRLCELEGFMVSLTGIVGLWSLAILALERYVVVCRPLGDFRFKHRHAVSGCAFTWSWSLLWTTPPLMGWSSYVPEGLRTSCGPNWYTGGSNNNSYILALFVTCFVMPLSLILFSYANLLMTLRAVSTAGTGCGAAAGVGHDAAGGAGGDPDGGGNGDGLSHLLAALQHLCTGGGHPQRHHHPASSGISALLLLQDRHSLQSNNLRLHEQTVSELPAANGVLWLPPPGHWENLSGCPPSPPRRRCRGAAE